MRDFRFSKCKISTSILIPNQGALAAVPNNYKNIVQCLGYNLDTSQPGAITEEKARRILENAIRRISEPVS